ncbi:hypothetical protein [Hymenobacter norwichensis]|uniref:hypothetical protein n=1 Tax=Hymenobacter norwichensis TaxID=223903 RepID=UPI0003B307FD|nr:hypothetical protein [Hymenobacter norwichensis]
MKTILLLLWLPTAALAQKKAELPIAATDSTYGYTALNPLRLKQGDLYKSMALAEVFLHNLRTSDDQPLRLITRFSVKDPGYKRPAIALTDRYTGLPLNGKLSMMDLYIFRTASNDTLRLFVDVSSKGPKLVPVGLKYVGFQ